jgi:hypothetical protein
LITIGIDPGLDGAVAVLGYSDDRPGNDGRTVVFDTPTLTVRGAKGNKREYNLHEMAKFLRLFSEVPSRVYIEKVHSMPGQGVRSMFSMGYGAGAWAGILAALDFSYSYVSPQRWKGVLLDGMGKDKDAGRFRAIQLFPDVADQLARKKDDGRADALLIAEYGRRQHA